MSTSYDSVTQKRRPAVRGVLVAVAAATIFGASVSAASEVDVSPVVAVVDEAALTLPTTSTSSAPTTTSVALTTVPSTTTVAPTTTTTTIVESVALADVPDAEEEIVAASGFAVIEADADGGDFASGAAVPSTEVLELVSTLEEQDRQITVLSEQLAYLRQTQITNEYTADTPIADVSALAAKQRLTAEENAAALDLWLAGYTLGGGSHWSSFRDIILPCESGSQPNPDTAVGRTDDWGRAQINRPVWETRFESLTGVSFETGVVNPTLNGFMAAHVEQEQGLTAWTCWRNR